MTVVSSRLRFSGKMGTSKFNSLLQIHSNTLLTLFLNVWLTSNDFFQLCSKLHLLCPTLPLCSVIHQEKMGVIRIERDRLFALIFILYFVRCMVAPLNFKIYPENQHYLKIWMQYHKLNYLSSSLYSKDHISKITSYNSNQLTGRDAKNYTI